MKQNLPIGRAHSGPPVGIAVSFGKDMMDHNGGQDIFVKAFEHWMVIEGQTWMHKCKNKPQEDIAQVYILMGGKVYCRVFYAGYERHFRKGIKTDGSVMNVPWPRILLAGPIEKPHGDIPMRGFQGFRYIYEPLF